METLSAVECGLLVLAGLGAGALNAVAGGGSFLSFPALLVTGLSSLQANATSTVALWPGSLASALGYRRELREHPGPLRALAPVSLLGGLFGALLLVRTPEALFNVLVPFLLLTATLAFTFGDRLRRGLPGGGALPQPLALGLMLPIAMYGGYFGGGLGMMVLAALTLLGMDHVHRMNGVKAVLGAAINGVAVGTFLAAGLVAWLPALLTMVGAVVGGYGGAALARRLPIQWVRRGVIVVGWVLTAAFFVRFLRR
ncbi:MAG: sulfite exporter TauE/SafE family protein [Myxococcaceae bacterium]|nr:sulfite exporter TauE/SafE family protein [Myxococcaceae bacterium]MCI0673109.1 sulfite exporter TauE/SafE family protein [Myxococcaceae bacterium]